MLKAYAVTILFGLLLLGGQSAVGQESVALPVIYNAATLQVDGEGCPNTDQEDAVKANISEDIRTLLRGTVLPVIQGNQGYGACGCGGPGWTRIAYLNMTNTTQQCPSNWNLVTSPRRSCGRSNSNVASCDSAMFMSLLGVQYSQVCGRIIGYGIGSPNAFFSSTHSIDSPYVDGVSITYGNPRQHIWTFAGTWDDTQTNPTFICPCTNINVNSTISPVPSFVGDDYFCETGVPTGSNTINAIWDGDGCGPTSACCTFNNPPWFCKQLAQPTTDDFEVRICSDQETSNEDTPIELIEVYIK